MVYGRFRGSTVLQFSGSLTPTIGGLPPDRERAILPATAMKQRSICQFYRSEPGVVRARWFEGQRRRWGAG